MKLVVQVKLLPTPVQAAALEATLAACNEAANWVSQVAFEQGVKNNFPLRRLAYDEVKARWSLGAQAAQHVIKKTCDSYASLKANLKAGNLLHAQQPATDAAAATQEIELMTPSVTAQGRANIGMITEVRMRRAIADLQKAGLIEPGMRPKDVVDFAAMKAS
ncbi:hypothetical protein [Streptomyces sp. NPDC047043]|uniref:hypothetical protein n=1 Tax=Streptomyces sp. NPDC047043 TaxID=3154497 RepID=UPI0033D1E82C